MENIIMVLGAPNDEKGNLSQIALDRLNCVVELYNAHKRTKIICTGGFGSQFNTTKIPHADYARSFLISNGICEDDFLENVLSSNTVDDFKMSKEQIWKIKPETLWIVTSDFHMERVKILQRLILNYPEVVYIPAKSSLSEDELKPLILHEVKAIQNIKENNYIIY